MKRRYPLHIHISTLFLTLIILVGGLIGGLGYQHSREILETSATDLTTRISRETANNLRSLLAPAEMATNMLSFHRLTLAGTLTERMQSLGFLREAHNGSSALSSLYVGYPNGDFFFVRKIRSDSELNSFNAPANTVFIVQSIERNAKGSRGEYQYLDADLKLLRFDERPEYGANFDPRTRDWFKDALQSPTQIKTAPYLFFSNQKIGTTLAKRAEQGGGVVGADILLETLSKTMAQQKITPGMQVVLVDAKGFALAYEDFGKLVHAAESPSDRPSLVRMDALGAPVLAALLPSVSSMNGAVPLHARLEVDDAHWRTSVTPILLEGATPLYLVTAIPERELLAVALTLIRQSILLTVVIILLAIPVTWYMARGISRSLRALVDEAESIRHFEFDKPVKVTSMIVEVNDLATTMQSMKRTIRRFLDISLTVASEDSFERLLPRLLDEMVTSVEASAGVLYLSDAGQLVPAVARTGDGMDLEAAFASIEETAHGTLLGQAIAAGQARAGNFSDAEVALLKLQPALATHTNGRVQGIAVPLLNRQHQLVGAMLLVRAPIQDEALISFAQALSGPAAVSLENKELIQAQKDLFEAFIQLIASAIDAKSPYTGGHCARVPELTKMLARAACDSKQGPYADFSLNTEEWEAVHIAAWLHDCGKITTPDFVVDKATKLETLYDRIHEVRMRFEVLKRDAEIAMLKEVAAGADAANAHQTLKDTLQGLDDDFALVAVSNVGGEFMDPQKMERLRQIGQRTWLRTLDDRLGISHEEAQRKAQTPSAPLPAMEPLLADKAEHLFPRRVQDMIPENNRWGFRMAVPELLYNRGELHNLCVARGTLNDEERYKINEHIVQTLIMLSQLPFPKHLRQVPEIAGGHHEKMDGTGYPKRLTREDMSPVARMMAIADIFEALTAMDRPYKKGKTLSEAIAIMAKMKREAHIDPDLFDLFLRSGIYLDYAHKYMPTEQMDAVDVEAALQA